ncbi:MAG: phospholipase D family protein [Burkholderiaceae bacterium]|nr:phospholipase D family protein [Burkholderiaceae bacterium]MDP3135612.1 phospholipase D family protein [Burkholderiaceae bacterium]
MKHLNKFFSAAALGIVLLIPAVAGGTTLSQVLAAVEQAIQPGSTKVPTAGEIEIAFSPNQGAEALILRTIGSARSELRVMAYSFTSAPVTSALIAAKKRGVDVYVVADHRHNAGDDRSGKARAALSALATAGVHVRTVDKYAILHDKFIIADKVHTQTGSFNYSAAAARSNSENVLVVWNNPRVAEAYLGHWASRWRQGTEWRAPY